MDDGGAWYGGENTDSTARTMTVNVSSINDAPVNTRPAAVATPLDTAYVFTSNAISIADVDAGSSTVQVTLTATNGTLSLSGTTGLSFSFSDANGTGAGDGTADATMTFRGTIAAINAALDDLEFEPSASYFGTASLQIITNDLGNTGAGGALTDTDTVNVNTYDIAIDDTSFLGDLEDYNFYDFDELENGSYETIYSEDEDFGFNMTTQSGATGDLFVASGFVSTDYATDKIVINFIGNNVTAIGGNFWATDIYSQPVMATILLTLSDGSTITFEAADDTVFRGIRTSIAITSITIDAVDDLVTPVYYWPTLDNLIVGTSS
jgi:hypothetical protein